MRYKLCRYKDLNYFERCNILNSNAVLLARYFQHKDEIFFQEKLVIRDGPLGKFKYYTIRVEFQFRGSPHIHSFLWVLNAPTLPENTINEYVEFLDSVVCGTCHQKKGIHICINWLKFFKFIVTQKYAVNIKIVNVVSILGVFLLTKTSLQYRCKTH